ncbi:MAG: regulatory iron-sulfur-containing complex subunit RicT [Mucinivorans sp.]
MSCKKNISRGCCFGITEEGKATAQNIAGAHKMEVFDYLQSYPLPQREAEIYEVRFKNTRKSFYANNTGQRFVKGDIVAVEGTPGVDIGLVSMVSDLVWRQMRRTGFRPEGAEFKKILRRATATDIERWQEVIACEHSTMIRSRQISASLGLEMKIGDVEYQGDGMKAIFYYIADGRVDFRELIKVLFEQFRVRVEMKQIGARQEAGRIGGISACGRELCCSSWINHFSTIGIGAARVQDISPNPQKLAGQCGKLKCCLNYEADLYAEARRSLPRVQSPLEAIDGSYYLVKTDILSGTMYFSPDKFSCSIMIPLSVAKVREIQEVNRRGEKVERIEDSRFAVALPVEPQILNVVGEESITRFDRKKADGASRGRGDNEGNRQGDRSCDRRARNNGNRNRQRSAPTGQTNASGAKQAKDVAKK